MVDAYGKALLAYFNGDRKAKIKVESNIVDTEYWKVSEFFHSWNDMSEIERKALGLCKGRTLDVGAGSGSHSLWLKENGVDVSAIDISAGAVEVMLSRGVNAQRQDFYALSGEKFDTLLLLMNGAGIAQTMKNLPRFLEHCKSLLNDGGSILMDSSDLKFLYDDEDLAEMEEGQYYGEIDYWMSFRGEKDELFDWLFVDFNSLKLVCESCGLKAEKVYEDNHFQYLAKISLV